ncbi:AbiH family protein [Flavobacterium sp.]
MNRLVIIGNGFDLAHGLPTGYGHFIDSYWSGIIGNISKQH